MEQAIIALLGFTIALIFYLDRGRRADHAALRTEVHSGFAEVNRRFDEHRKETRVMFDEHRKETREMFKQLLDAILDLTRRVGRLEGRFDTNDPQLESA
ncbi:MAG: hypothetical protein OXN95_04550 [bacterium]|nr:hypothetical protein [bacterium]